MALNYWHRPIFPAHIAEDNLVSPMRIVDGCLVEGIPERHGEGFEISWDVNPEIEDCYNFGKDRVDGGDDDDDDDDDDDVDDDSSDSVSNEAEDSLPDDPFNMEISAAFTDLFGNFDMGYDMYGMSSCAQTSNNDHGVVADFGSVCNNASSSKSPANTPSFNQSAGDISCDSPHFIGSACNNKAPDMCCQGVPGEEEGEAAGGSCCSADSNDGAPHEALSFALGYVGVTDLLSVEMTCRTLCSTVRNDPLLWRKIHIDKPLNEKITDDSLLLLTSRAQGNLYCLSLLECTKITDNGLKRVVESNPQLNKLCVPACTRLSIEGIVGIVKTCNQTKGRPGIRCLRIGGIYGVTDEHYETLMSLLDTNVTPKQKAPQRRHFYVRDSIYVLCDDDRAIDIQECPRCQKLRLVYDCPFEGCHFEDQTTGSCRACALCIHRCSQCGRCVDGIEYEENFWLELHCSDCRKPSSW